MELSERALALWQNDEYRTKVLFGASLTPRISSIQILLYELLDRLGLDYYKEGPETVIGYYMFDCLVKNRSGRDTLIECQGDYWHKLPNNITRDKAKFTYTTRYFPQFDIMYIWEHEFYDGDCVLDRLRTNFGIKDKHE